MAHRCNPQQIPGELRLFSWRYQRRAQARKMPTSKWDHRASAEYELTAKAPSRRNPIARRRKFRSKSGMICSSDFCARCLLNWCLRHTSWRPRTLNFPYWYVLLWRQSDSCQIIVFQVGRRRLWPMCMFLSFCMTEPARLPLPNNVAAKNSLVACSNG